MGYRIGVGFFGSEELMTTTEKNTEIIQQHKAAGNNYFAAYSFSFKTYVDCHIKVNGVLLNLEANMTFNTSYIDPRVETFIIVEEDVIYTYMGAY